MTKQQSGFTLIELVLVIVILGILAATALPRFSDLSTQARIASISGLMGGLRSGASIAHATYLAKSVASGGNVDIDGQNIVFTNGYPDLNTIDNMLTDFTGFTYAAGVFTLTTGCSVTYAVAAGFPSISSTTSGC